MTIQEVKKIAQLSRIELTEEELKTYRDQLTHILDYVAQLNEVDTENVPITAQVTGLTNVFREDVVEECLRKDELLEQSPELEGKGVKVKSVF